MVFVPNAAYRRRVKTLLDNEDYGPKLARLNNEDQRSVLELVYRNQGREARSEILRLDRQRRALRNATPEEKAVLRELRKLGVYRPGIDEGLYSDRASNTAGFPSDVLNYVKDLGASGLIANDMVAVTVEPVPDKHPNRQFGTLRFHIHVANDTP